MKRRARLGVAVLASAALCGLWSQGAAAAPIFLAAARASVGDTQEVLSSGNQPTPQNVTAGPIDLPNGSSVASGRASPGSVGAAFETRVQSPDTVTFVPSAGGSARGFFFFDDLLISGPDSSSSVLVNGMNVSLGGMLGASSNTNQTSRSEVQIGITGTGLGVLRGSAILEVNGAAGTAVLSRFGLLAGLGSSSTTDSGVAVDSAWTIGEIVTTPDFNASTVSPLSFTLEIAAGGTTGVERRKIGSSFSLASFADSLGMPTSGPVFNLPAGFTANSVDANIVNNRFIGGIIPVPEPATLALFAVGLLGLGSLRRRRASA